MVQHVRDFTPTPAPSRRSYIIARATQPGRPTARIPRKHGNGLPRQGRGAGIGPFDFVPSNGQHGGIPVVTGRVPSGTYQTVCVTERKSGVSVRMVVLRGRLHLYGESVAGPVPTEGQVRAAVGHLLSHRSTARRLGLPLEPIEATFAHRPAPPTAYETTYDPMFA